MVHRKALIVCVGLSVAILVSAAFLLWMVYARRIVEYDNSYTEWLAAIQIGATLYYEQTGALSFNSSDLTRSGFLIARDRFGSVPAADFKIESKKIHVEFPEPRWQELYWPTCLETALLDFPERDSVLDYAFFNNIKLLRYYGYQLDKHRACSVDGIVIDFNDSVFTGYEVLAIEGRSIRFNTPGGREQAWEY